MCCLHCLWSLSWVQSRMKEVRSSLAGESFEMILILYTRDIEA